MHLLTLKGIGGNLYPGKNITNNAPPFETSMERGRYAQIVSFAESGDFNVNEFFSFLKPDVAWYSGNFYSTFPVGAAFIATPFYILGKYLNLSQVFTSLVFVFFTVATSFLVYKLALKLGLKSGFAVLSMLIYSLTSVSWPYSVSISAHPISAFIMALGVYTCLNIEKSIFKKFLLGILFGSGLFIDYPNLAIFVPIVLTTIDFKVNKSTDVIEFSWKSAKTNLIMFSGFMVMFAVFVAYNLYEFKKPFVLSNTYTVKFLETEQGIDIEKTKLTNDIFKTRDYSNRFSLLTTLSGVNTLTFSHDRGLLYFSPVYIFGIYGLYALYKDKKALFKLITAVFLLNLFLYGSYDDPWGGWAYGPRYLIASLPLMAVMCSYGFYKASEGRKYIGLLFTLVLIFSSGVALLGALTTNAVPPSVEVAGTGKADNFVFNWGYLQEYGTSSYFYNSYAFTYISPTAYAFILLGVILVVEIYIIMTLYTKK